MQNYLLPSPSSLLFGASNACISSPSISCNVFPAIPCKSPYIPTVACMTRSICSSRLAHFLVMAFFSLSRSSCIEENASTMAWTRWRNRGPVRLLVDHFHLGLLAFSGLASRSNLNKGMTEHCCDGNCRARMCHPDTIYQFERFNVLWQGLADNNRDISLRCTLVFPAFWQPAVAPVFGSFRLPQD